MEFIDNVIEMVLRKPRSKLLAIPGLDRHEQIAALPAEEILLRGSDEPVSAPEELLRAGWAATVEPAEALLRAESKS
jgi:hypothetical protein